MILVAGATGNLGSEICRRLRARGAAVRGLARATSSPERVQTLEAMGVDVVRGDLRDRASLEIACRGVETVISTVSMIVTAKEGDSFDDTDNAGTRALVDAARSTGVRHFIFVSFDWSAFPDSPLCRAKRDVERSLVESGLTYTILHPALFMESWLGPIIGLDPIAATARILGTGDNRLSYVALGDVAELAVQCVTNLAANNATIPLGGPEAMRQRDAIGIFEDVIGRAFTLTHIPEEALREQWTSAADPFSKTFAALMLGASRDFVVDNLEVKRSFDLELTPVRRYAERVAGVEPRQPLSAGR
jgi:uncharacterized protein YbjT (DUF2867 family)